MDALPVENDAQFLAAHRQNDEIDFAAQERAEPTLQSGDRDETDTPVGIERNGYVDIGAGARLAACARAEKKGM